MPTEYELNNEKKQFENPLYTIAVYRIPRDEESFRKYLKNLFDDILTEVDYIIQGDTVEDLEKELKDKPIWDGSFYTLFENLRYEDIASGEFHFGEIKKDLKGKRKEHIASGNKRKMYFISKPIAVAMLYLSGLIC